MVTRDKITLGVIVVVLALAGYILYSNWGALTGHRPDSTIANYVEERHDPNNPMRDTRTIIFASYKGRLEIVEYPNDHNRQAHIIFVPDRRRDPGSEQKVIDNISDPCRRMLTIAGYRLADHQWGNMLRAAKLTSDQQAAEAKARQTLTDAMAVIQAQMDEGTFQRQLYQKVLDALARFQADHSGLQKPQKQALGAKVVEAGMAYLAQFNQKRQDAVASYVNTVYPLLHDDQQKALGEQANALAGRSNRRTATAG